MLLRGVQIEGETGLVGANIGGSLECDGSSFTLAGEKALNADRLQVQGSGSLSGVKVEGEARFLGAKLGGDFTCIHGRFSNGALSALSADMLTTSGSVSLMHATVIGEVRFVGARLDGNFVFDYGEFINDQGRAVNLDGVRIDGAMSWRKVKKVLGLVDLAAASAAELVDDVSDWPSRKGDLILTRFHYEAMTGGSVDGAERLRWLALQDPGRFGDNFWPQPYEHCAKVLPEMGHREAAREILIEKERLQREAQRKKAQGVLARVWRSFREEIYRATVRYSYAPLRTLWLIGAIILAGWAVFDQASEADAILPNNAFVLRAPEWVLCGMPAFSRIFLPSQQKIVSGCARSGEEPARLFRASTGGAQLSKVQPGRLLH